jgi:hypothetical protein
MLIILVLGASYLFVSELNRSSSQTGRDKITAAALAQAKEALIGRAATDDNRPGSLPCPDTQDDGSSEGILNKDCNAYIGRLPWRTLGLPDILDGAGERLWYALSPAFRDDDSAEPVNPFETHPDLTLDSPGGAGQYAALIIAPGAGVCGQDRAGNNHYDPAQYLELDNGDKNNDYVSRPDGGSDCQSSNFNDKVIGITPAELRRVTQKRIEHIQSEVGAKLREYFKRCHFLPWAAPFGDPSTLTPFISDSTNKLRKGFFPLDQAAPADWGKDCNGAGAGTVTAPQIIRFRQNHWDLKFPNVFSAPLYYAVGNGYTQGQEGNCAAAGSCLSVSGNSVAAVLIAPGVALAGQTRPSAAVADYLEGGNASIADDIFEVGTASASFNDILMQVNP